MTPDTWLDIRRARFPHLRRPEPVGIVRNGGTKRVYECAFCRGRISMSAKYPVTKRVREFCRDHNARCLAEAAMTDAEKMSRRYRDDGQTWRDANGIRLGDALEESGARAESRGGGRDECRWTFPDGSILLTTEGGWDLGRACCWAFAGLPEHEDGCNGGAEGA